MKVYYNDSDEALYCVECKHIIETGVKYCVVTEHVLGEKIKKDYFKDKKEGELI